MSVVAAMIFVLGPAAGPAVAPSALASTSASAQGSATAPLMVASLVDARGLAAGGMAVQLWRYPDGGGTPSLVDQEVSNVFGRVALRDSTFSASTVESSWVHYAFIGSEVLRPGVLELASYDWSAKVTHGVLESRTQTVTLREVAYAPNPASVATQSWSQPLPAVGGCTCVCPGIVCSHWEFYKSWATQPTVVGEVHATSGMTATFELSVSSGVDIEVAVSGTAGPWTASGTTTITNSGTQSVTWPAWTTDGGIQVVSYFDYVEDQYYDTNCNCIDQYKVFATTFDGGTNWGAAVSGDDYCSNFVTSGTYGKWAPYLGGSTYAISQTSGIQYSVAVSLAGAFNGLSGSLSLTDTTDYSKTETITFNLGTLHSTYYAYSNANQWTNVYWTNSDIYCTVGCVLSGTHIQVDGTATAIVNSLKVGDAVLGWDPSTHAFVRETVLGITHSLVSEVESINGGQLIVTLMDQPLYVQNGTWVGWVHDPAQLRVGERLFAPTTGAWITITSLQFQQGNFKVYDLEVSAPHDFIANGFLALDKGKR